MSILIFAGKSLFAVFGGVRKHNDTSVIGANLPIQSCFQYLLIPRKSYLDQFKQCKF